ncbi:MAG: nucleotidyltransferase domain-containing protein [Turicibacter sp.]|nr:nucleotidyltransferase domain-containing protein [Turicibacter sp.]
MQICEGYVENGRFYPDNMPPITNRRRAVLTILDESEEQAKPYNALDNPAVRRISQRIYEVAENVLGDTLDKIYLGGSYARGDYDEESDINYTILADLPPEVAVKQSLPISRQVRSLAFEFDILVSIDVTNSRMFSQSINGNDYKIILRKDVEHG